MSTELGSTTLALEVTGVSKSYGGIRALTDVSLTVGVGEVNGLIGANGSGKSTFIKIISGVLAPEPGARIRIHGREIPFPVRNPGDLGFAVLHQQNGLIDDLTVVESVGIGVRYGVRWRPIRWAQERAGCAELAAELGVRVDPNARIGSLSAGEKALVALMRGMREMRSRDRPPLFILDEPTATFTTAEVEILRRVVREVADRGGSILFVSHKLSEVLDFCDRVTVLRGGRVVATHDTAHSDSESLVEEMLGTRLSRFRRPEIAAEGSSGDRAPALHAKDIEGEVLRDFSLDVWPGEIVGVTGLVGSGHDEVPYLLSGAVAAPGGTLRLHGEIVRDYRAARRLGLGLVPGDRVRQGLWMQGTAAENVNLPALTEVLRRGPLDRRRESARAASLLSRFGLVPLEPGLVASGFSGGNQQKIVLAKAIQSGCSVLILHEPTVGVDVGSKVEIYEIVARVAADGAAVLVVGGDHEEIAAISTQVVVLRDGVVAAHLAADEISEERVARAANLPVPATR